MSTTKLTPLFHPHYIPTCPSKLPSTLDLYTEHTVPERRNTYQAKRFLSFTDSFSHDVGMNDIPFARFTANATLLSVAASLSGSAGYIARFRQRTTRQLFSKISRAIYLRLGIRNTTVSSQHPITNGSVAERVNYIFFADTCGGGSTKHV